MSSGIAHSTLDTDKVPAEARFRLFQAAANATHDVDRIDGDDRPFHASLQAWLLGDLVITAGRQSAVRMSRTAERLRADGFDHITFACLLEGEVTGLAGGPVRYGPSEVAVFDLSRPMRMDAGDNANITVRLSRSALRSAPQPLPDLHGRVLTGLAGRIATDHFTALVRYAPSIGADDIPLIVRITAALMASCLRTTDPPGRQPGPRLRWIRERAEQFIEANLARPDLGPASLCRGINVSRSTLYRAFDGSAGIAGTIRKRRLEAAYQAIKHDVERQNLRQIATACGFDSGSHFSSVFRSHFGLSPREVASGHESRSDADRIGDAYRRWLSGLRQEVHHPSCEAGGVAAG